jgi:hypothetical protein
MLKFLPWPPVAETERTGGFVVEIVTDPAILRGDGWTLFSGKSTKLHFQWVGR